VKDTCYGLHCGIATVAAGWCNNQLTCSGLPASTKETMLVVLLQLQQQEGSCIHRDQEVWVQAMSCHLKVLHWVWCNRHAQGLRCIATTTGVDWSVDLCVLGCSHSCSRHAQDQVLLAVGSAADSTQC
jgi:hypothetical protein